MDRKRAEQTGMEGRLPSLAPLANPYVPFQQENPPKYDARMGLIRGTLFPGLDLPFLGMENQKELPELPMAQLQALGFAVQELALYLDTHRQDLDARELYRSYQDLYARCQEAYSKNHGPLNHMQMSDEIGYGWLTDPWPWEYCANKEG